MAVGCAVMCEYFFWDGFSPLLWMICMYGVEVGLGGKCDECKSEIGENPVRAMSKDENPVRGM